MTSPIRFFVAALLLVPVAAIAQDVSSARKANAEPAIEGNPLYMKVRLDAPLKLSRLKSGDQVSGKLLQDVYSGTEELFSAASGVHLVIDGVKRRRRVPNDHWPWMIKVLAPRHEKYPVFRVAIIASVAGHEAPLLVSVVSIGKEVEVAAKTKKKATAAKSSHGKSRRELGPIVTLEAHTESNQNGAVAVVPGPVTVAPGTEANVILLRQVSASRDHAGDSFQARLVEPIRDGSKIILPEGSVFEGKIVKSRAPRTLSRSGSIYLAFTNLTLPGGSSGPVKASIASAELSQRSHTVIDAEGQMHGDRPGKAWMLLNAGITGGISKEVDDGTQLVIEAIISTATDASTAGTAKIAATCASGIFLLTRHGRDVVLPKYTQMKIVFDRPAQIPTAQAVPNR